MQQHRGAEDQAHPGRRPGREHHGNLRGKPEGVDDVGEEIQQKAADHAADDHQRRAAAPLHAQAECRGDEDHGAQQKRAGEQGVEMQTVPKRAEARLLKQRDEAGQIPERHRIGGCEALLDLARSEPRRQAQLLERLGGLVRKPAHAVGDLPGAFDQTSALRVDARGKIDEIVEEIDGNAIEVHAWSAEGGRMHDDLIAGLVALPQPQSGIRQQQRIGALLQDAGFQPLIIGLERRRDRIEDGYREDADDQRHQHRRGEKLPHGHAGRAGDDELVAAGQPPEHEHRPEQHGEGQDLLRQVRLLQRRQFEQPPQGRLHLVAAAPDQLDVVGEKGDDRQSREHRGEPCEKLASDIGGERLCEMHRQPPPLYLRPLVRDGQPRPAEAEPRAAVQ